MGTSDTTSDMKLALLAIAACAISAAPLRPDSRIAESASDPPLRTSAPLPSRTPSSTTTNATDVQQTQLITNTTSAPDTVYHQVKLNSWGSGMCAEFSSRPSRAWLKAYDKAQAYPEYGGSNEVTSGPCPVGFKYKSIKWAAFTRDGITETYLSTQGQTTVPVPTPSLTGSPSRSQASGPDTVYHQVKVTVWGSGLCAEFSSRPSSAWLKAYDKVQAYPDYGGSNEITSGPCPVGFQHKCGS